MEYYCKMRREDPVAYAEYARNKTRKVRERKREREREMKLEREKKGSGDGDVAMALTGPLSLSQDSTSVVAMTESKIVASEQEIVAQLKELEIVGKGVDKRVRFSEEPEVIGKSTGDCGRIDVLMG